MEKFLSQISSAFNNQYKLNEGVGRAYKVKLNKIKFFVTLFSNRSSSGLAN